MAARTTPMPSRLAQSAFALFSRNGIQNVNLDRIAAHAGVTKGSLYWHFESKDEIIQAACSHYYRTWHRRINAELAPFTDPLERLERALRFSVRTCLLDKENRVFTLEIFTLSLHDEAVRRGWRQFLNSVREFYIGLLEAARAAGRIKTPDPQQAVDFLLAAMEGIKLQALFDPQLCSRHAEKQICEQLMRTLGCVERRRASATA